MDLHKHLWSGNWCLTKLRNRWLRDLWTRGNRLSDNPKISRRSFSHTIKRSLKMRRRIHIHTGTIFVIKNLQLQFLKPKKIRKKRVIRDKRNKSVKIHKITKKIKKIDPKYIQFLIEKLDKFQNILRCFLRENTPPGKFLRPPVSKNINSVLTPFRPFDPFVALRWFWWWQRSIQSRSGRNLLLLGSFWRRVGNIKSRPA